jgi:hypothetical protein
MVAAVEGQISDRRIACVIVVDKFVSYAYSKRLTPRHRQHLSTRRDMAYQVLPLDVSTIIIEPGPLPSYPSPEE